MLVEWALIRLDQISERKSIGKMLFQIKANGIRTYKETVRPPEQHHSRPLDIRRNKMKRRADRQIDSLHYRIKNRKKTLLRKANQLAKLGNLDVAVIVREVDRYHIYRSTDKDDWPPPIEQIVRKSGLRLHTFAHTRQQRSCPPPEIFQPCKCSTHTETYGKQKGVLTTIL